MTGEMEAIVIATEREWDTRVQAGVTSEIITLYTEGALFFGSNARLYVGREQIAEYFDALPKGYVRSASFRDRAVALLADDVIVSAAYVTFVLMDGATQMERHFRITFTLSRGQQGWKIAQHHASPLL